MEYLILKAWSATMRGSNATRPVDSVESAQRRCRELGYLGRVMDENDTVVVRIGSDGEILVDYRIASKLTNHKLGEK